MSKRIIIFLLVIVLVFSGCTAFDSLGNSNKNDSDNEKTEDTDSDNESYESNAIHIGDSDFDDIIPNTTGVAVVDFWADWCGPCIALAPTLEKVCEDLGATLYKVNVDENQELSKRFQIASIPTVLIFKDGVLVDNFIGMINKDEIIEIISQYTTEDADANSQQSEETTNTISGGKFAVTNIGDDDFHSIVPNSTGLVVVDFWADWCGPCVALGPVLEKVCEEQGAMLYKVNVDENSGLSEEMQIQYIPFVQIYKDGVLVDNFTGNMDEAEITDMLQKYK